MTRVQLKVSETWPPKKRGERIDHRAQNDLNFSLLAEYQFSIVTADRFHRIAAVHRAPAFSNSALLLGTIRTEHEFSELIPRSRRKPTQN